MGSKRDERRVEINRKWEQYLNLNRDKKSKIEAREVSADSARLDIIDWLARRWPERTDRNERSSVELEDIATELAPVSKGMRELAKKLGTITEKDNVDAVVVKTVLHLGSEFSRTHSPRD